MPVRKISEHCLQIRRFNLMNCYLVSEADGLTVVDTALGCASIIVEAARQLGGPIRRIVLTHGHTDHVGSLDALKKRAPEIEVFCGRREAQLIAEAANGVKPDKMTLLPGEPQTPVKGSFRKLKNQPQHQLDEGDRVGSLQVMATPGHTPGHIAFFDPRDGNLFAGDAFVTFGEIRLPFDSPAYFPLPKMATWHFPTSLESARRIASGGLAMRQVLAGHGPAVANPASALRKAIERGAARLGS